MSERESPLSSSSPDSGVPAQPQEQWINNQYPVDQKYSQTMDQKYSQGMDQKYSQSPMDQKYSQNQMEQKYSQSQVFTDYYGGYINGQYAQNVNTGYDVDSYARQANRTAMYMFPTPAAAPSYHQS
jgi:hypothetical protein